MEELVLIAAVVVGVPLLLIAGALAALVWKRLDPTSKTTTTTGGIDIGVRMDRLEHGFKMLKTEWQDKESRLDSIVRRGIRQNVIERVAEVEEVTAPDAAPPISPRAAILKEHREKMERAR